MFSFIYLIYLVISIVITLRVGEKLRDTGLMFLTGYLQGNIPLALTINNLLMVGFYLTNVGYILLILNLGNSLGGDSFRTLTHNLGFAIFLLGAMHVVMLAMLAKWKPETINNLSADGQ